MIQQSHIWVYIQRKLHKDFQNISLLPCSLQHYLQSQYMKTTQISLYESMVKKCGLYIYQRILLTSDFRKQKLARGNLETDRETGTEMERRQRWPSLATACERQSHFWHFHETVLYTDFFFFFFLLDFLLILNGWMQRKLRFLLHFSQCVIIITRGIQICPRF